MTTEQIAIAAENISLTRVNNDVNGNPRYVVHFHSLFSEEELKDYSTSTYELSLRKAKTIGGRKSRKPYFCGIVFQSYNERQLREDIVKLANGLTV